MQRLAVPCLIKGGFLPEYKSAGASGADLLAAVTRDTLLAPGERKLIPTGLTLQLPRGYEAQIRPRSGLAAQHGVTVLNAPGTIDADYRGELKVLLINLGKEPFTVKRGDRIAQIVFQPATRAAFIPQAAVEKTERGGGGFGSTGI